MIYEGKTKKKKKKEKLGYIKNCDWERNDSDTDFIFFFFLNSR